jgi:signal peptidase I
VPVDKSFGPSLGRTIGDLVGVSRPGERDFIKRVIGLPGDKVACCDVPGANGRITVNGQPIDEAYLFDNSPPDVPPNPRVCGSRQFTTVTIPPGHMWVMGDHRGVSQDARCEGPVPIENVIGRAFVIVWPSSRFTGLDVPPVWKDFAAAHPTAAGHPAALTPKGDLRQPGNDPLTDVIIMPFLVTAGISARSGLTFSARRRRLRS